MATTAKPNIRSPPRPAVCNKHDDLTGVRTMSLALFDLIRFVSQGCIESQWIFYSDRERKA